jgi:hypothetical protein
MKKVLILSIVALSITMSAPARSELIDYGLDREMFYDTATGQYWYDPVVFLGQSREQIDLLLADNPEWKLANKDELICLVFQLSVCVREPAWSINGGIFRRSDIHSEFPQLLARLLYFCDQPAQQGLSEGIHREGRWI